MTSAHRSPPLRQGSAARPKREEKRREEKREARRKQAGRS